MGYRFHDIINDIDTRKKFIKRIENAIKKVLADNTVDVGGYNFKIFVIDALEDSDGYYYLPEKIKDTIISRMGIDEEEFNNHKEFFNTVIEDIDRIFSLFCLKLNKYPYRVMMVIDLDKNGNPKLSETMKEILHEHLESIISDNYWRIFG